MRSHRFISLLLLVITLIFAANAFAENVIMVIIDGARYSETLGDPERTYIPEMDELADRGTYADEFHNDQFTYTSRAVPAIWCGDWTAVRDTVYQFLNTQYTLSPSIFEYFRHDTDAPATQCYYILKYVSALWLPSFHPEYGPDYWPTFISDGQTDTDVLENALDVMHDEHPQFMLVYFADVDHAGHDNDWEGYLDAIETADACVGALWSAIQADEYYSDNTTLMVTNDHGRHDDNHGGFSGHGDSCDGCRHIMMLAIGPNIGRGVVTTEYRTLPDFAVTACEILGVNPAYAGGNVMDEIFVQNEISEPVESSLPDQSGLISVYPNPFNDSSRVSVALATPGRLVIDIFNLQGSRVKSVTTGYYSVGTHQFEFDARDLATGLYFVRVVQPDRSVVMRKVMLVR
jgi:Metalloenzyme superfamily/Secretion system C-terminal sorting domain